ncbi:hypothetical protein RDABS01_034574 [Bienertia sinuspersici]
MGLWWKDVNVRVISFSTHHFMVEVLDDNNSDMWRAVGIYGWPEKANKYKKWELMKEKEGGVPRSERCMDGFRELIDDCSLHDLGYQGSCFTWQRGVTMETLIRERLDRFLACEDWCNLFPSREVRHLPIYCSDHAPIILTAGKETNMWAKKKLFKFESFWLSKPECEDVIRNSWSEELYQPADIKLAKCASVLEEWAATAFGDVKKRIRRNENLLKDCKEGPWMQACWSNAGRGFDPSFAWRSLWGAKSLLLEGLKWRVGDGRSIRVWDEAWLPGNSSSIVPTPNLNSSPELMVCNLINSESGKWDIEALRLHFTEADVHAILDVPLVYPLTKDMRFWWPTHDGIYTVKSGYWFGVLGPEMYQQGYLRDEVWKRVWGVDGPPKLHHFLWRACSGSLAVNEIMCHRHMRVDSRCSLCLDESETIFHSIFTCAASRDIWASSHFTSYLLEAPTTSFKDCFMWMARKLNKDELSLFATLAWAAWTSRNKRIFHLSDHDPRSIAVGFSKYVADYKRYALNVFGARLSLDVRSAAGWNPPPSGVVKVNTDAAVFDGGGVGLGAVVRDEKGGLLAIGSKRLGCRWSAAMAEAAAINYGLLLARRLNYMEVWLECDAMELVGRISSGATGRSPLFLFLHNIKCMRLSFRIVAHLAARLCSQSEEEVVMSEHYPQSIRTLVELDLPK